MSKKVYVGMSGGVDSSVTAALLKEQGYDVTGVYMKNWSQDLPGMVCPWKQDYQDAKRVAVQLGIDFKMYDFQTEYRAQVVDYMLDGYKAGITPNPDVMCNQEVKFKLFLQAALADGADMIATGHYARVQPATGAQGAALLTGIDTNKDQSYFLYRVTSEALGRTLMPIGEYEKPAVRELARTFGLSTAEKKDSQGICFVGKVGIKEFLLHELGPQAHGAIIAVGDNSAALGAGAASGQAGTVVGEHDGALFYTIGQRHGLDVGGGLPYYVVGKDMAKNEVYVTRNLDDERLWLQELTLTAAHWINGSPTDLGARTGAGAPSGKGLQLRTRYRAPLVAVKSLVKTDDGNWHAVLAEPVRAVTPGQSAVFYQGDHCLGGGIVI